MLHGKRTLQVEGNGPENRETTRDCLCHVQGSTPATLAVKMEQGGGGHAHKELLLGADTHTQVTRQRDRVLGPARPKTWLLPTTWRSLLLKLQKRAIPKTPWWQSRESNAGIQTHRAVKAIHLCCIKPLHLWEFVRAAIGIWHECTNDSHTAWAKSTCWVSCRPRDGKACDLKHPWPLQAHWTVWGWDQFSLWGFFLGGVGWGGGRSQYIYSKTNERIKWWSCII